MKREERGAALVEFALACIIGLQQLGSAINETYQSISTSLKSAS